MKKKLLTVNGQWRQYHSLFLWLLQLQISLNLHDYGYFHLQHSEKNKLYEIKKQKGIVRTNCVDCLDRTNVVQSVIAKKILLK
jgi:hypothetical protein